MELATCRRRRKKEGGEKKEKKRRRKDKIKQEKEKQGRKKCYFFHFKIIWSLFFFLRVVQLVRLCLLLKKWGKREKFMIFLLDYIFVHFSS